MTSFEMMEGYYTPEMIEIRNFLLGKIYDFTGSLYDWSDCMMFVMTEKHKVNVTLPQLFLILRNLTLDSEILFSWGCDNINCLLKEVFG